MSAFHQYLEPFEDAGVDDEVGKREDLDVSMDIISDQLVVLLLHDQLPSHCSQVPRH